MNEATSVCDIYDDDEDLINPDDFECEQMNEIVQHPSDIIGLSCGVMRMYFIMHYLQLDETIGRWRVVK